MRALILLSLVVTLIGCEKDCDCGLVRDDGINCSTTPCIYGLYVENDCGGEGWQYVDQYTWLNVSAGDRYCAD